MAEEQAKRAAGMELQTTLKTQNDLENQGNLPNTFLLGIPIQIHQFFIHNLTFVLYHTFL